MKFKTVFLTGVAAFLCCVVALAAEMPDALKDVVPVYPEAKVTTASEAGAMTTVKFETTAGPEEVFQYYKKTMTERGWKSIHEKGGANTRLVMVKDDLQFGFGSHGVQGSGTRFFCSIKQLVTEQKKPAN